MSSRARAYCTRLWLLGALLSSGVACKPEQVSLGNDRPEDSDAGVEPPRAGHGGSGGMLGGHAGHSGSGGSAAMAGSEPAPDGAECGVAGMASCDPGMFCFRDEGVGCGPDELRGHCAFFIAGCSMEWDPVCGCDDRTYNNLCIASLFDVGTRRTGSCRGADESSGAPCGGPLGCGPGEYCHLGMDAQCGAVGPVGSCELFPTECDDRDQPSVCGCNEVTYENGCDAALDGMSIRHLGDCNGYPGGPPNGSGGRGGSGNVCGGFMGGGCGMGEYCDLAAGDGCGPDAQGLCTTAPLSCQQNYQPVCGCDDLTYTNGCVAAAAGMSVAYGGECAP